MDSIASPDIADVLGRAAALLRARRVRESLDLFDKAVALGADPLSVGGERWMAHMLLGAFDKAWEVSDLVLRRTDPAELNRTDRPFHQRAVWDGTPFDGRRVLVRCYHGLGDIVQFARYLPLLARRAAGLAVQAPEAMHPLLAGMPGAGSLHPLGDAVPLPAAEVQAELMELPYAFRTSLATLPAEVPYLRVEPARRAGQAARVRRRGSLAVGIAWAAGAWDGGHRSLPLEALRAMMAVPGVDWVCLQRGAALQAAGGLPFCDDGPRTGDLRDTAAMIQALDLVVSVDTVVAHLAGALGVPTWTLLHHEADWRWLLERDDSPWYPTMRLFRQPAPGRWDVVAQRVRESLAERIPDRAESR